METALETMMAADAATMLRRLGETVTYAPAGGGGGDITAIVYRDGSYFDKDTRSPRIETAIQVLNDATDGIALASWTNRDTVTLPRCLGGPTVSMRLVKPIHQSPALVVFQVQ